MIAVVALLIGPSSAKTALGDDSAASAIRIAVVGPMSGDLAEYGMLMRKAAEMAVADVNAAGGVLGRQLELVPQDDRCDVEHAKSIAEQVVARRIVFVVGHFCSGMSIPASEVYYRRHVLMITPASSNPRLTDAAASNGMNNVFRISGRDDQEGRMAGDFLADGYANQRIALVSDGTRYGALMAREVRSRLESRNLSLALEVTIDEGESDYSDLIDKLIDVEANAVFFGGYHQEAAVIVRQMRERGVAALFLGPDSLMTEEFAELAGAAADGVRFVAMKDHRQLESAQEVSRRLGVTGYDLAEYGLTTYAAIQVFVAAVAHSKSTDVDDLAAALHAQTFDTVVGRIEFDDRGDLKALFWQWYEFADGTIRPLE